MNNGINKEYLVVLTRYFYYFMHKLKNNKNKKIYENNLYGNLFSNY